MAVRRRRWRDENSGARKEAWMVDVTFRLPNGTKRRIREQLSSLVQTKREAEEYERRLRQSILDGSYFKEVVPTFDDWFTGRFWREWVVGRKNKPSEVEAKECVYRVHLKGAFGKMPLDKVDEGAIARFRAALVERGLSDKRVNNILTVLSKPLRYAEEVRLIPRAPRVGLLKVERPEIEAWGLEEYISFLAAAQAKGSVWFAAACLGGEAGLRVGEIKALDWKRDVDMVARTITVNAQTRRGVTGTPKGRTRRTVPMTETLYEALRGLGRIRVGHVICNEDGSAKDDNQIKNVSYTISEKAGLPPRGWHTLRHTFATHAALFGVNPWALMQWLGHKRIDETMLYINFAKAHARPIPQAILDAGATESDPDRRIVKMLGARHGTYRAHERGQSQP